MALMEFDRSKVAQPHELVKRPYFILLFLLDDKVEESSSHTTESSVGEWFPFIAPFYNKRL